MDCENVFETMVSHAMNYITANGLHAGVLGVSGGIDSTVVAYIFKEVQLRLKETYGYHFRFVGVSMPTETTDKNEFRISELVGNAFCDTFEVLDITDEARSITLPHVEISGSVNNKFRIGNVKSRLRMIHLYDYAKAYGGIVLGTDNYTEYLLGYSTLGGDALFDYCPIQYLWKTEIYELANWFLTREISKAKWDRVHALSESINIPPQAGLGITSTDLEEIGAPSYEIVDTILQYILSGEDFPNDINEEWIKNVARRWMNSEYKRNHPVVIEREDFNFE